VSSLSDSACNLRAHLDAPRTKSGMSLAEEDDFGLSSTDEQDLLDFADSNLKRPHEDDNAGPAAKKRSFGSSSSFNDDLAALAEEQSNRNGNARPTASALVLKLLKQQFGLEKFRLEQEAVISRLLAGESAVVVFPTGGGKSLCYQVCFCPSFFRRL
jgi:superfamily II DNA helicase RecQ